MDNQPSSMAEPLTARISTLTETKAGEASNDFVETNVLQSLNCQTVPRLGRENTPEGYVKIKTRNVRLGVVAVQIQNPENGR